MTAEPVANGEPISLAARFRPRLQHVFGTAFVCAPILAGVVPLGLAPLFAVVTFAALLVYRHQRGAWPWPSRPVATVALLFIVWLALTVLWTATLPETLRFLPRAALYVVAGIALLAVARRLSAEDRRVTDLCLVVGAIVGAALFALEVASDGAIATGIHRLVMGEARVVEAGAFNRNAAFFAIVAFPAAVAARRRFGWPVAAAILGATLALTLAVQGSKAALAGGLGLAVLAGGLALGSRIVPLLAAAVVLLIVTAPLQPKVLSAIPGPWATTTAASVTHRLIIWRFVSERISERPVLGWGLNSSRAIPGGKGGPAEGTELLPLHPHNTPLQFWLELGGIGALIAAAGLAGGILMLRQLFRDRTEIGLAAGAVAAAVAQSAIGYGAWQGWWLSGLWVLVAALIAVAPASAPSGSASSS